MNFVDLSDERDLSLEIIFYKICVVFSKHKWIVKAILIQMNDREQEDIERFWTKEREREDKFW